MDLSTLKAYDIEDFAKEIGAKEFCKDWWKSEDNLSGDCCCNCVWQMPITGHPWNKNPAFKGSVTDKIGFGCCPPDLFPIITFFESPHGMCECHSRKKYE